MAKNTSIKLFENKKVRSIWDAEAEKWYISIVDVIEVLTESNRPRKYWDDLKRKLQAEGSELSEKIGQLKMQAPDGKMRLTDVADVEQLFRLIQSIPSPKAEPFKLWLAEIARERLEEIDDPELGIERLKTLFLKSSLSSRFVPFSVKLCDPCASVLKDQFFSAQSHREHRVSQKVSRKGYFWTHPKGAFANKVFLNCNAYYLTAS